jgi:hypothetical protein
MKLISIIISVILLSTSLVLADGIRPATKMAVGETVHFTLDKGDQTDFAVLLAPGAYYIVCDIASADGTIGALISKVQLLKSNGSVVKDGLLRIAEMGPVVRVGDKFTIDKPLAARLRVSNDDEAVDMWMTVIPAKQMRFVPFGFKDAALKPLAIGSENGKGGALAKNQYAFHAITLQPGKYNVSLYFRQSNKKNDSLIGSLERYDAYGFRIPLWRVAIGSVGQEERRETSLLVTKPQTVIFRVVDTDNPVDYIVGVEKTEK